jgi:hypothetical protein
MACTKQHQTTKAIGTLQEITLRQAEHVLPIKHLSIITKEITCVLINFLLLESLQMQTLITG